MAFLSIAEGIEQLRQGKLLIVTDDESRENEGDFIAAAETITPEQMNFITLHGRGLVCVSTTEERLRQLDIPLMVSQNTAPMSTQFCVTVDYLTGTTTGISASDRTTTCRAFADPAARSEDFGRPGHISPLRAKPGGVLARAGHTEAVVDLLRIAGMFPAGVLCEILDADGSMAHTPRLEEISQEFGISIVTIANLIAYRRRTETLIHHEGCVDFPTRFGKFNLHYFTCSIHNSLHLALVKGDPAQDPKPCLVRVHSQCLTGDTLGSLLCDCGAQLEHALQRIEQEGVGVLLYLHQEGRGIGLLNKLKAYSLQAQGLDTVEANVQLGFKPDLRDYGIGAQILHYLGVRQIRLMTNNPRKVVGLRGYGLEIVERLPITVGQQTHNERYLETKKSKLGHLL